MSFRILHFRDSEKIIVKKGMEADVWDTFKYVDSVLCESTNKGELLKQALKELQWRDNQVLNILDDRRYQYKGLKNGVAIEGSFCFYEFILEGLFRLQVGYDKGKLDTGILLLNSLRSESVNGDILSIAKSDVENLYPTISMPVSIALFDLKLI